MSLHFAIRPCVTVTVACYRNRVVPYCEWPPNQCTITVYSTWSSFANSQRNACSRYGHHGQLIFDLNGKYFASLRSTCSLVRPESSRERAKRREGKLSHLISSLFHHYYIFLLINILKGYGTCSTVVSIDFDHFHCSKPSRPLRTIAATRSAKTRCAWSVSTLFPLSKKRVSSFRALSLSQIIK